MLHCAPALRGLHPAFLAPVGRLRSRAMQARGALRTRSNTVPSPRLYAFRRGARDDARGSSRSSKDRSSASSSHSSPGTWATDAMAARRWNSGVAIFQAVMRDARVDVGVGVGLAR